MDVACEMPAKITTYEATSKTVGYTTELVLSTFIILL